VSSSTIKLNISSGILRNAQGEADRIGISLQDFIRMLMATYFAHAGSVRAISHDQMLLERAGQEIRGGEYTKIQSKKELNAYFDSLDA
ncbi:hypothetical protein MUP56_01765, partial [Patescibacteria group bacterium]|nr:hypothetical protein [Patescibacteria group bacterium]